MMGWKVYEVYCPRCGKPQELLTKQTAKRGCVREVCKYCGFAGDLPIDWQRSFPRLHFLEVEGWWEHIAEEPIYIRDKKHLREECEKRGLTPRIALDGYDNPLKR